MVDENKVERKGEDDMVSDFRRRISDAYQAVADIIDEAAARGIEIRFQSGTGPDGKHHLLSCKLLKEI